MNVAKIITSNVEDVLPLTKTQQGMLFYYLRSPTSSIYNEQLIIKIKGKIESSSFNKAWQYIVQKHPALRAIFRWNIENGPIQIILKDINPICTISHCSEIEFEKLAEEDKKKGFNLQYPSIRISLFILGNNISKLIINYHHIICDGWSLAIILKDLFYFLNIGNKTNDNSYSTMYSDIVTKYCNLENNSNITNFWIDYLKLAPVFNTSFSNQKKIQNFVRNLDLDLLNQLKENCVVNNISISAFFYTMYSILYRFYFNLDTFSFGMTMSGRNIDIPNIDKCVGLFIKTLPLKVFVSTKLKFYDLSRIIMSDMNKVQKYNLTNYNDIKKNLGLKSNQELFDSALVIENYPIDQTIKNGSDQFKILDFDLFMETNYDFTLSLGINNGIEFKLGYNSLKFKDELCESFYNDFYNLLKLSTDNANFGELEICKILDLLQDTTKDFSF